MKYQAWIALIGPSIPLIVMALDRNSIGVMRRMDQFFDSNLISFIASVPAALLYWLCIWLSVPAEFSFPFLIVPCVASYKWAKRVQAPGNPPYRTWG